MTKADFMLLTGMTDHLYTNVTAFLGPDIPSDSPVASKLEILVTFAFVNKITFKPSFFGR